MFPGLTLPCYFQPTFLSFFLPFLSFSSFLPPSPSLHPSVPHPPPSFYDLPSLLPLLSFSSLVCLSLFLPFSVCIICLPCEPGMEASDCWDYWNCVVLPNRSTKAEQFPMLILSERWNILNEKNNLKIQNIGHTQAAATGPGCFSGLYTLPLL